MNAGSGQGNDSIGSFFWGLVLIIGGTIALWLWKHEIIVAIILAVRLFEMSAIGWFVQGYSHLANWLDLPTPTLNHSFDWWRTFVAAHPDKSKMTFEVVTEISTDVGKWLRVPVILILAALGSMIYFRKGTSRFSRSYSMDSFKKAEADHWPAITPVVNLNLVKQDLNEGPWAMAALPLDYCQKHQLLTIKVVDGVKRWATVKGAVHRQFVLQLGPLWGGPIEKMPIHVQALVVIFVTRAERDFETSTKLIKQISGSSGSGKLNFTGVKELVQKNKQSKAIRFLEKRHAYTATMLASLIEFARASGVLATSEILWLKPLDRRLWYMLNSVGRQTPVVEVAGLFAHWLAEKKLKRGLKTPMVKEAVTALDVTVADILYVEKGDVWHSSEE